ncbi:LPD1 domain-containing protein [Stutzerimonas stutzeri]|uniref:LPD1 domain-containing protein n=1 Tax=Stutzerimonas stutzeri TaxID=316 RepID=UPI0015E3EA8D|nr:LPD1 domain-containing protein [Stutzerimonas stutzeri]MBA1280234.1 hypothetical protein [Stutzerimonas stutzeri]
MDNLPSVWGRHKQALIDPMLVRGKLLTSVMDPPEDWVTRLAALGFRKTNSGWIKLGPLKPAEFSYLSPEIDLIGLRADDIHEAVETEPDPVPLDVKDTLLRLWQRQLATVMVALSMEHETSHTRAQAWSFVEAALAGEVTPETETLFGLTLTKLNRDMGALPAEAQMFADQLGWKKPAVSNKRVSERPLFSKGESIEWMDSTGVLQTGRLARKVGVSDLGCWVYQSPRWVVGYTFASPQWVSRSQLYFTNSAQDWLNEQIIADIINPASEERSDPPVSIAPELDLSDVQRKLLERFIHVSQSFPPLAGVEQVFDELRQADALRPDVSDVFSVNNLAWLKALEQQLNNAGRLIYGDSPLRFVLKDCLFEVVGEFVRQPGLTVCAQLGAGREMGRDARHTAQVMRGDKLTIEQAVKEVEKARADDERIIRTSSAELADLAGQNGKHMVLASDFHGLPMLWPKIAEFYDGQVPVDDVIRLQSVVIRGSSNAIHRPHGKELLAAFEASLFASPHAGAPVEELIVSVKDVSCSLVDFEDVARELSSGRAPYAGWINEVPTHQAKLYEASVRSPRKAPFTFSENVSHRVYGSSSDRDTRHLVTSPDEAIGHYVSLLDEIEPLAEGASKERIEILKKLAANYALHERLLSVPKTLAAMPGEELRQRVKAQVYMQEAKRVNQMTDADQERMFSQIAEYLRAEGSQGVVTLFSSTSAGFRWRTREVPITAETFDQTRQATLESAMLKLKSAVRSRGVSILVDGVAIADPELAELLNGGGPAQLKEVTKTSQEGYQDTGVVAGWAMKDIRGMRCIDLLDASEQMSDQQKSKYLTRELIWPRKSFEEMKEAGVELHTAYAFDILWKAMPKAPLTSTRQHVNGFINLVTGMRDALEPLLKLPFITSDNTVSFSEAVKVATNTLWNEGITDSARQMYRADAYIRGYGRRLRWDMYSPASSSKLMGELAKLSWSDVLKTKKTKAATASGSRVVRGGLVRKGPDYRGGKSVTGEDFIRTFGFSGVEYGNWTNQVEREKHLNLAFDSMMDFVRIMGWEPLTLSLGGKLGLCIGSRGRGGSRAANAHFEPVNMAINLTRMRGDGALAHEYFHAVAYHYGRLAIGSPVDMTDTFGYVLQNDGPVPQSSKTGLRPVLQKAFHDLVVAIMRQPPSPDDYKDIEKYTIRSAMLTASMAMDNGKSQYWGSPSEMFARAMEIWFKDRLHDAGEQNDYLVRADKNAGAVEIYPDVEHLSRINHFVSPWLDSIKQEVSQVQHPFLGRVEMPILNTEMRSVMPLTSGILAELASSELDRLFRECAPGVLLLDDPVYRAGMYDLSRDLIILNAQHADRGTFYHEAWHACHMKLLTSEERIGLSSVFDTDGPMADRVEELLREQGVSSDVIGHMRSHTQEVQAYAFQLWQEGRFSFDDVTTQHGRSFYRVGTFVEGVTGVGEYFGPQEAERLFTRFMAGELSERSTHTHSLDDVVSWDSDSVLYWETPAEIEPSTLSSVRAMPGMR